MGRELIRLANIVVRLEEKELIRAHALSYRQMRILKHIHGGVTSSTELGKRFGVTAPAISETVESMVKKGLVKRRVGTQDRRSVILSLTPAGKSLYEATQALEDQLATEVLSFISPAETKRLGQILSKLVDNNQERLFVKRRETSGRRRSADNDE